MKIVIDKGICPKFCLTVKNAFQSFILEYDSYQLKLIASICLTQSLYFRHFALYYRATVPSFVP